MAAKYTFALLLVVAAIAGLQYFGGNGLPFDAGDVEYIRFIYTLEDTTQVVIRDPENVAALMSTLKVEPKGPCLCAHQAQVILSVSGEEQSASVCGHCFDLGGRYHGYMTMPEEFAQMMAAYKDSVRLREPWEYRTHAKGY